MQRFQQYTYLTWLVCISFQNHERLSASEMTSIPQGKSPTRTHTSEAKFQFILNASDGVRLGLYAHQSNPVSETFAKYILNEIKLLPANMFTCCVLSSEKGTEGEKEVVRVDCGHTKWEPGHSRPWPACWVLWVVSFREQKPSGVVLVDIVWRLTIIWSTISCHTKVLIYLVTCPCGKSNVVKTSGELKTRTAELCCNIRYRNMSSPKLPISSKIIILFHL